MNNGPQLKLTHITMVITGGAGFIGNHLVYFLVNPLANC